MIDQVRFVDGFKTLEREGWLGTVANQAFQTSAVVGRDAHVGVEREPTVLLPLEHGATIVTVKITTTHKPTHDPLRDACLNRGDIGLG